MKTNTAHRTPWSKIGAWFSGLLGLLLATASAACALANDNRAPEVSVEIAVAEGNKVHFHGFALGFQIYMWNGTSWGAAVPAAVIGQVAELPYSADYFFCRKSND